MNSRRNMAKWATGAVSAVLLFVGVTACVAHAEISPETGSRPRIGLVLSGGGARGAAHIGVIRVLEELRIPIDYIAGTSMGSIVGGLYASGMSVEELEKTMTGVDWSDAFIDAIPREDRSFRRKRDDDLYLFKSKAGFNEGSIDLPAGVLQGQKIDLLLKGLTVPVEGIRDFDRLRIPFRAVATDIVTGREAVLDHGNLALAMRASMSIPGVFSPVEIDGRLLVDGGVSNNIPADVVRQMGADILIVVDISTPLMTRGELGSVLDITNQLTGILTRRNSEAQLATLGMQDILIVPDLTGISSSDFDKAGEAIPRGMAAAGQQRDALAGLSAGESAYQSYLAGLATRDPALPVIDFVRLDNRSRISDEMVNARLHVRTGEPLDVPALEKDISQIYGLELFENIRYEIVEEEGRQGVLLHVKERSWGPNYLQFGLVTSDDFEGDSLFNFGFAYTRTLINQLAGEWRTAVQIGRDPVVVTELYQPLDVDSRYFVHPSLIYRTTNSGLFEDGHEITEYRVTRYGAGLAVGRELGTWGELRLGYRRDFGEAEIRVGDPAESDYNFDVGEVFLRLALDKLNEIPFPNNGSLGSIDLISASEMLGSDSAYEQCRLSWGSAGTWGRHTLIGSMILETTLNSNAPLESRFTAGGLFRLSGFQQNELSGQHFGILRLAYFRRFWDIDLLPVYIGGTLEQGNVWDRTGEIEFDNTITAGSLFVGLDTPIGPVYLGYGMAEYGSKSLYLYIGKLF